MNALSKAIEISGGVTRLAVAIGVGPNVVSNWRARQQVPADKCLAIERATAGMVTAHQLRPDIFGLPPRHSAKRKGAAA